MKALVYAGPKRVEVQEVKEPEKQDGKVKLNIRYCGVCGSDIGIYLGTHPRAKAPYTQMRMCCLKFRMGSVIKRQQ